jgi:hypothetical protein
MLDIEVVFRRLECCYTELLKEQSDNLRKLIVDEELDYKVNKAYALIKTKLEGFIGTEDYDRFVKAVNEACGKHCCVDCDETEWVGINPICEEFGDGSSTTSTTSTSTTSTSTTSTSTSSTTSSSSTTTKGNPPPVSTTTTTTTTTSTTTSTTSTSTSTTSSTTTTTAIPTTTTSTTSTSSTTSSTSTTTSFGTTGVFEESTYFSIGDSGGGNINDPEITAYLNSNQEAWNNPSTGSNDILFDIDKPTGNIFTYSNGNYDRDDVLSVMSLSKGVTAAVILTVIEQGLLSLSTTVGSLLPDWASASDPNKANITLQQIIAHTSGIPDTGDVAGDANLQIAADKLAENGYPLNFTPGTQFMYSTTSYVVAARMAEVATGQSWLNLFNTRIRDKCAMGTNAVFNPLNPNQPNPGYELYCTQIGFRNFMSMIRDGGVYNGQTVLQSSSLDKIKNDMTGGLGDRGFGFIRNAVVGANATQITLESAKACYAWVDTEDNISCVLFAQGEYSASIGANNGLRTLVRNEIS